MDPSWESLVSISPSRGIASHPKRSATCGPDGQWQFMGDERRLNMFCWRMLDGYMMLYGIYLYLSDLCGIWMMLDGNPLVMTNGLLCNK
jgi:hypothetical protein